MKRIIGALLLVAVLSAMLAGCGLTVPRPEVKSGEFDASVTYEENGESKTLDLVFVCEYEGIGWTLEGSHYRDWKGYFKGYGEGDVIEICTTEDGGKVALCILIYPEYFMGEPGYDDFGPTLLMNYIYYEDGIEMIEDDQEIIAENYGIRGIGIECDAPIENSFDPII